MKGSDFVGAGITAILIGIFSLIVFGAFKRVPNQKKVKGIIYSNEFSHFEKDIDGGGKNLYHFFVQYFVDGKEYLLKSKSTSGPKKVGKRITVKYDSKHPEKAIVEGKGVYIVALIFICFGIYAIYSTIISSNNVDCCACLDCPECDACCDCNNPYLNK